jgi:hypothetical protein
VVQREVITGSFGNLQGVLDLAHAESSGLSTPSDIPGM